MTDDIRNELLTERARYLADKSRINAEWDEALSGYDRIETRLANTETEWTRVEGEWRWIVARRGRTANERDGIAVRRNRIATDLLRKHIDRAAAMTEWLEMNAELSRLDSERTNRDTEWAVTEYRLWTALEIADPPGDR